MVGIGVDIVSVEQFKKAFAGKPRRLQKVFCEREIADAGTGVRKWERLAARFAAKEAVMKSIGKGIFQVPFHDIRVERAENGKPSVHLSGKAFELARSMRVDRVLISLSHQKSYAVAYATAMREGL